MKKIVVALIVGAVVVVSLLLVVGDNEAQALTTSPVAQVWIEPTAGYAFLDEAVLHARRTIEMSMYELKDPTTEEDLIQRAHDGVFVRILLNAAYESRGINEPAATTLRNGGVHVAWAPSSQIFHAKYVVVDGASAYIGTGNFESEDYASTRDFWVRDAAPKDVRAIASTFDADFAHRGGSPVGAGGLVWSPGSTSTLVSLITKATSSLLVENEEMNDSTIEQALKGAAKRGVKVEVVMARDSEWNAALAQLRSAGVKVSILSSSQVYIHAKVICADCAGGTGTVFIGSENFSVSSLVYNRELGVVTSSPAAVRAVDSTVRSDFATGSH